MENEMANITSSTTEIDLSYLNRITLPGFPGNKKVIYRKKLREKQKKSFSLKSKGQNEVLDLNQEPEEKNCPNCLCPISTVDIPDKCPNCEYELRY